MDKYSPPGFLFNRHLQTIFPSLLRRVHFQLATHERIVTPDDDFLDLDWYKQNSGKCLIISHGLEGNSTRGYVKGMARAFFLKGFDVVAWNFRGCSGEPNRQLRFYHSGATDDLHTVVNHVSKEYNEIYLLGFSLGGNLTLKYLGENNVPSVVKKAVAISVPLNLHTSCVEISKPANWIYTRRFLKSLRTKVKVKAALRDDLDTSRLDNVRDLMEFDDLFTGPLHGFRDAMDYYNQCSSINFIESIRIPTLVVNARNDPFLGSDCFPEEKFKDHPFVNFEFPEFGGHVGFTLFGGNGLYWSELRALEFIHPE